MKLSDKIYVAGHTGLVGSALVRKLTAAHYDNIIVRTIEQLDLRDQAATNDFFKQEKPDYVFLAAARVGGILANAYNPAPFVYDNLAMSTNIIHAAYTHNVKKLLFFGSSCIYPRMCAQPIREEYLMTGPLESTNYAYAVAKIAGLTLCQSYYTQYGVPFISCMPTNLYGPNDYFDKQNSHVIPGLVARMYHAMITKESAFYVWGSGEQRREFLFVDDLADAAFFLMHQYHDVSIINVGTGQDIAIKELAYLIKDTLGYQGNLFFDTTKPDGTPRKLLAIDRLTALGWHAKTSLEDGIRATINWYLKQDTLKKEFRFHESSI